MPVTATNIVNQAIQLIGDNQPLITGNAPAFDNSPGGIAASLLYMPAVQTVGRQFEWDMARNTIALSLTANTPPLGWLYEYLYPSNGIEVWQVTPATLADPNNPLPTNWVVANNLVSSVQKKVIHTSVAEARAVYNNSPTEDLWDPLFREAVVRQLASEFAVALFGRPDIAQAMLETGAAFEKVGEGRDS